MHIILGGNGHVGSALAKSLLRRGQPVMVVLHNVQHERDWHHLGAQVAVADVHDTQTLRRIFKMGERLFILNPPAPPSTDTSLEERKTASSILAALDGSGLKKVVAESTYSAQPGERVGDLSVLYEMEQSLASQPIPVTVLRAAYYMSNWDMSLQTAKEKGEVPTFYPPNFQLPMVAPQDIGEYAADLMIEPVEQGGLHCIEGPQTYSSADVADAFAAALNKPVRAIQIPREQWLTALQKMEFSEKAAQSFANMTDATLNKPDFPTSPQHGATTLQQYIQGLVQKSASQNQS